MNCLPHGFTNSQFRTLIYILTDQIVIDDKNSEFKIWNSWSDAVSNSQRKYYCQITGKSLSEALILASTICQKNENSKLRTCCVHKLFLFWHSEQCMYTTCSELGIFMYWTGDSMINLLSYCGLVFARKSASEKDLPVHAKLCPCPLR